MKNSPRHTPDARPAFVVSTLPAVEAEHHTAWSNAPLPARFLSRYDSKKKTQGRLTVAYSEDM